MRKRLSTKARLELFLRFDGRCHICKLRIHPGEKWETEHVIPIAQGGEDGGSNLQPAHTQCHAEKTKKDAADTARAKRRQAIHLGARAPSRNPIPGGKASGWKRKMNGEVVRR
jgi:5-methylcytosine-specific restriction endonuclease McrA